MWFHFYCHFKIIFNHLPPKIITDILPSCQDQRRFRWTKIGRCQQSKKGVFEFWTKMAIKV
ncbi:hypothetical protein HanXRQr2_Chr03g0103971 [Helianthus annuus]|uniref:Uncharacterized protein n=1 Tax=Helianthus annuus TaxID=4232 RepID=A0A9K3JDZ5_HELAN|nr:hypothetical protein HanXRQr2_Chr03g0103971 [Helianthus annuus]KAJ0943135.1 hypothetical protein HanPSC8_Chr03g0100441 [Helianthus annuus]